MCQDRDSFLSPPELDVFVRGIDAQGDVYWMQRVSVITNNGWSVHPYHIPSDATPMCRSLSFRAALRS